MQSIGLQQNLAQTTKLTPTQIQVIRMLELPSIELSQRINEELQENPALEEGRDEELTAEGMNGMEDEFDENYMPDDGYDEGRQRDPLQNEDFNYEQYVSDDETPSYMLQQQYNPADEDRREVPIIGGSSLIEELKAQIYLTNMTKPQRHIAKWVLGNIDDDGYLRRTTEQLVDDIMFQEQISVTDEEMESIVRQIKQFDPPGIASADLQECLIKQLEVKLEEEPNSESIQLAITILSRYFEHFSKHHFALIEQRIKCTDEQFQDAVQETMQRTGKKLILIAFCIFTVAFIYTSCLGVMPIPAEVQGYILCVIAAPAMAIFGILPQAVVADIAECDEIDTKENRSGMFYAARTFAMKMGQAVAIMLVTTLGTIQQETGFGYRLIAIIAAIVCALGGLLFMMYNEKKVYSKIMK